MLDESTRGVYVISVTPFDDRGALDLDGTDRLIDYYAGTMRRRSRSPAASLRAPASCQSWSGCRRPASPRSLR
jgi:hypothetical protein